MKTIEIKRDIQVEIEGRKQTAVLRVTGYPKYDFYFISAITETGSDLCDSSYGYYKHLVNRNTRLRSEKSIQRDMNEVLDQLEASIRRDATKIILTQVSSVFTVRGTDVSSNIHGLEWTKTCNIDSKQSGRGISWYEHDVYNDGEIEVEVYRNKDGQLRMRADETKLYNKEKLQKLHDSEAFQQSKFAFFNYNEVRRLLGLPTKGDPERMSGFLPSEAQE